MNPNNREKVKMFLKAFARFTATHLIEKPYVVDRDLDDLVRQFEELFEPEEG